MRCIRRVLGVRNLVVQVGRKHANCLLKGERGKKEREGGQWDEQFFHHALYGLLREDHDTPLNAITSSQNPISPRKTSKRKDSPTPTTVLPERHIHTSQLDIHAHDKAHNVFQARSSLQVWMVCVLAGDMLAGGYI